MKILFDTNVILDLLLNRKPFVEHAGELFRQIENGTIEGVLSATTITTIFYLSLKVLGQVGAKKAINHLLSLFEIAAVNRSVLEEALIIDFPDFEDAVLYQAACHSNVDVIVTRNGKDYKKAKIPVYTPAELLLTIA